MTKLTDDMRMMTRQGAVWYGPPIEDRIIDAACKCAAETGASEFTAKIGTIEWDALMTQQPLLQKPQGHVGMHEVVIAASAGRITCSHDPLCDGIYVTDARICGARFTDVTGRPAECNLGPGHIDHHKWRSGNMEVREKRAGRERYAGVREAIEVAKWIPKITNDDVRAEFIRRGLVDPMMQGAQQRRVELLEHERDQLQKDRDHLASRVERCTRDHCLKDDLERATEDELRAECERRAPPQNARIGDIVEALGAKLDAGDTSGACDVLDKMFLSEWPGLEMKLPRDIRGLAVAAYNAGKVARDEWKRRAETAEHAMGVLSRGGPVVVDSSKMKADSVEVSGVVFRATAPVPLCRNSRSNGDGSFSECHLPRHRDGPCTFEPRPREDDSPAHDMNDWGRLAKLLGETGPGIAAKPPPQSEPHAHLLEDLLADDAP